MSLRRFTYWGIALALLAFMGTSPLKAGEPVKLYTYYLEAPYVTGEGQGLTYDLADYLNKRAKGRYQFIVELLPRKRLDRLINKGVPMVVPWANRAWFALPEKIKFHWSKPYLKGANLVITNAGDELIYRGPEALEGCSLAGVSGHKYAGVDALVAAKKLKRQDYLSYETVLRLLSVRRGHCTIISSVTANFLIKEMKLKGRVKIAKGHHSTFTRHFLLARQQEGVTAFLNLATRSMVTDPKWHVILSHYGLDSLVIEPGEKEAFRPFRMAKIGA